MKDNDVDRVQSVNTALKIANRSEAVNTLSHTRFRIECVDVDCLT